MKGISVAANQGKILKSGPLAVEECSYMRQCDVKNHLTTHYRRVVSAKSRVDNSTPKSLALCQKRRDAAGRKFTCETARQSLTTFYYDPNESWRDCGVEMHTGMTMATVSPAGGVRASYDPLEYHDGYFTQPSKPFTPRINRYTDRTTSALRHYSQAYAYEPPLSSDRASVKRRSRSAHARDQDADADRGREPCSAVHVPRLPLDNGGDHSQTHSHGHVTGREWDQRVRRRDQQRQRKLDFTNRSEALIEQERRSTDGVINKKDQELMYLQFVKEVTSDIIRRNISADHVIKQVFESHVERNKELLDEAMMRRHLAVVERDLGLVNTGSIIYDYKSA